MKVLSFTLARHPYGLPIEPVREIIGVGEVTPVPLTPGFLLGVINLRGSVVPVVDLAVRMGLPRSPRTERSCVLVVEAAGGDGEGPQTMGLLVDAVQEVLSLPDTAVTAAPGFGTRVDTRFVQAVHALPSALLLVLALERVLDLSELADEIGQGLVAAGDPAETAEAAEA